MTSFIIRIQFRWLKLFETLYVGMTHLVWLAMLNIMMIEVFQGMSIVVRTLTNLLQNMESRLERIGWL